MKHLSIAMPALLSVAAALAATLAASPAQAARDPFARPVLPAPPATGTAEAQAAEPAAPPQLRAIMIASGNALANIDGHILATGEWLGDYRVVRIRERSVTLATRGGVKTELTLGQADNK
jgi:hypothetical protein